MLHRDSYRFLRYFASAYPGRSAMMVALMGLAGVLEGVGILALLPLLSIVAGQDRAGGSEFNRTILDLLDAAGLAPTLGVLLGIILFSISLKAGFLWLAMKQVGYTTARVATNLRLEVIRSVLRARWGYFSSRPQGYFANAIGQEAMAASAAYREACGVLAALLQVMVYLSVSLLVSWETTLLAIGTGVLILTVLRGFVRMARAAGRAQVQIMKAFSGRLVDALQGIKAIKAMAWEDRFLAIMERDAEQLNRAQERRVLAAETLKLVQEPLATLVLCFGLFLLLTYRDEPFSAVLLMAFIFYRLITHLNTVQMRYQIMATGESAFWSLREHVDQAYAEREHVLPGGVLPTLQHGVRLDSVHFSFDGAPLLNGLSLEIPAGNFVALVGHSGAGKTTVLDLIMGLLRPHQGEVYVDGVPLGEIDLRAWRESIGYVPQETLLFNDTVLRNVTLGDAAIPREQVEHALRAAGAWEFLAERSGGLDATIGNSGYLLSGGQRQRLAIARALVRNPKLLVLDEVTTALDPATEAEICQTLRRLKGEVTIVAISHQQALRNAADTVYRLEAGRAVETAAVTTPAIVS